MTVEPANQEQSLNQKKAKQSEALTQVLWKSLWIALAVSLVWLGIEGGIRLYQRPAKLDAKVAQLEQQVAELTSKEDAMEAAFNGALEADRVIAPLVARLSDLLNQTTSLPMNALPSSVQVPEHDKKQKSFTDRIIKEVASLGDRLVRIQVVGDAKDVALTPAAQDLVRQQLRLHLLTARMALISQMPLLAKEELAQAEKVLAKHFQAQAKPVMSMQSALIEIQKEVAAISSKKKGS